MSIDSTVDPQQDVEYPESDGLPMAENTLQFRWIVAIQGGLDAMYRDDPNVFVAGDLFWYPVRGNNKIRVAPDTMVVFGRPKGDRGSYRQWDEGGVAPQVVFEVLSPGNRAAEMLEKLRFYERYGVEEYYLVDPEDQTWNGWKRDRGRLVAIADMDDWLSPRLGLRFGFTPTGELKIHGPDGTPFATYLELADKVDRERQRAEQERRRAEQERERAERLAARLKELGIDPDEIS